MSEYFPRVVPGLAQDVRHPFGLPLGSVRGMFSILICSFFWLTVVWPGEQPMRALLAHFFMLGLVVMAFASSPGQGDRDSSETATLPWVLRMIFVLGTIASIGYAAYTDINQLQKRLTPDPIEVQEWWIPFLATMSGGFAGGLLLRFILGRNNHVFQSLRSWLSVVGMVMLVVELAVFIGYASSESKPIEFLHYWQCVTLAIVSAYFGTRA